jgi:peptide/nickel transport system ATP-binding protein
MGETVFEVSGLSVDLVRSDTRSILHDVSFSLVRQGILGIVGESGSGKSVLARAMTGSIEPPLRRAAGSIQFRGRDLFSMSADAIHALRGREIGYIGSDPGNSFDPTLPVGRQIVEKLRSVNLGTSEADARQQAMQLLDAVRIPSAARRFNEFPFQYSGGMLQRAMIVDALIARPAVLIADNIVQPLDVTVAAQIVRLLRELRDSIDAAIVYIANSLPTVREVADEVLVLSGGRIVERGTADGLISNPQNAFTRQMVDRIPRIWATDAHVVATPASTDVILSVKDVAKTYTLRDRSRFFGKQAVKAVRGVSFDVLRGENFGLIGESGCGKSTLSRLLSWIEPPDRGTIEFEGRDIASMSGSQVKAMRHHFQLLLQDPYNSIPPHQTIGRAIEEPLRIHHNLDAKQRREKVRAVMSEVGLPTAYYERMLAGLSAGQRQRVNVARALTLDPKLLILDETLSSLDQVEQGRFIDLFEKLQAAHGLPTCSSRTTSRWFAASARAWR